jgi:putative spermidine/putrescine transport system permease protein
MRYKPADIVLLAAALFSLALFAVPQYFFVELSLYRSLGMGQVGDWAGFANYRRTATDAFVLGVIGRTILLSAVAAGVAVLISAPSAYWLTRLKSRWLGVLIVLLLISSFVSVVVKVLGLQILLGSNGVVADLIRLVTFGQWSPALLYNDFGVTIGLVQYTLPLMVLLLFGVFQNIPVTLEEAALVHGATDFRMFRRVLLPEASRGLLVAFLIAFNLNMGAFTSAALLGGGKVLTVPVLIQRLVTLDLDYPNAAALSVVLTLIVVGINLAAALVSRRAAHRWRAA